MKNKMKVRRKILEKFFNHDINNTNLWKINRIILKIIKKTIKFKKMNKLFIN